MNGYLLDNNSINFWHNVKLPEHAAILAKVTALPPATLLFTSVIVLGEIEDGLRRVVTKSDAEQRAKQQALREFCATRLPMPLPISRDTVEYYGEIRSRVFLHCYPNGKGPNRPERWICRATAVDLGIEENDLWITAQAAERQLVLVTHNGMSNIRAVVADLVEIQDWTTA